MNILLTFGLCLLCSLLSTTEQTAGTITFTVTLTPEKHNTEKSETKLWLPYPVSNPQQSINDVHISGNYLFHTIKTEPQSGAVYLYAEWEDNSTDATLTMSFHVQPHYTNAETELSNSETLQQYLQSSNGIPVEEFIDAAHEATTGRETPYEKAQGVYEWVIANTFRDPQVRGCGLGMADQTMNASAGGGKCADISAVCVAVARAAGIPARDVYGLRLQEANSGNITTAYHCWVEIYLPQIGWLPIDPADVRKQMLINDLTLKDAGTWKDLFWGHNTVFRVALEKNARNVEFTPRQHGPALSYFMYPFAQINGKTLDHLNPQEFRYSVHLNKDKK